MSVKQETREGNGPSTLLKYDNSKIERLLSLPRTKEERAFVISSILIGADRSTRKSVNQNLCNNESESGYSCVCVCVWHAVVRSYAGDAREVGSRLGNPLSRDRSSKSV